MTITRAALAFAYTMLVTACYDTAERNYDTLSDARADQLFERGWLPDILPLSARNITTKNQLDLNYSTGDFSFDPKHAAVFTARVSPGAIPLTKFAHWNKIVEDYEAEGLKAWSFRDDSSRWVFFCDMGRGYCEYMMY